MNLYAILAGVVAVLLAIGGAGYQGYRMGKDSVIARQARDDAVRMETLQLAQQGAAEAIAEIQVRNVTVRQTLDREIIHVPDYSRCHHSDGGLRSVNAALANQNQPAGDIELPATDPAN